MINNEVLKKIREKEKNGLDPIVTFGSSHLLCGKCKKYLLQNFTYDFCPFCGTKIKGGIDCRKPRD